MERCLSGGHGYLNGRCFHLSTALFSVWPSDEDDLLMKIKLGSKHLSFKQTCFGVVVQTFSFHRHDVPPVRRAADQNMTRKQEEPSGPSACAAGDRPAESFICWIRATEKMNQDQPTGPGSASLTSRSLQIQFVPETNLNSALIWKRLLIWRYVVSSSVHPELYILRVQQPTRPTNQSRSQPIRAQYWPPVSATRKCSDAVFLSFMTRSRHISGGCDAASSYIQINPKWSPIINSAH